MAGVSVPPSILIIGANRGIGNELATRFQAKGFDVYGTYRPQTRGDSSVTELKAQGVKTFEVDFTDEDSLAAAAQEFGDATLDILVNCAGSYMLWADDKSFAEMGPDDVLREFKVNVMGPFMASKAFLPALSRADHPKIITMSSDMASIKDNKGGNISYRISKAGVNQLTKTMAVDLQKAGSRVEALAVHPGWVPTKMAGFYGEDDMDTCMSALVDTMCRFGGESEGIPNGAYVRWDGEPMDL
ncbi:short chain dehydrogenase [Colletotrichum plurivorum]|uniref:Short chain dehydrogenase n=1 Tax=Colletotrichum plurivorum TaxID=2175906 RepID=A0A8H6K0A8_9PEZI|nr:short chain dehydrogenase [Colletotrichum plurivorum]